MGRLLFGSIRAIFFLINLTSAIAAAALIHVSLSAFDPEFGMDSLNDGHPKAVHSYISIICLGLGVILFLISAIGLYGSTRRSIQTLYLYVGVVGLITCLLLISTVLSYSMKLPDNLHKFVDTNVVNSTVMGYNFSNSEDYKTKLMDYLQDKFHCCGIVSPNDWSDYSIRKIPKSCCTSHAESTLPYYKYCIESEYKDGCMKIITNYLRDNDSYLRNYLYFLSGLCVFCVFQALIMIRYIKSSAEIV